MATERMRLEAEMRDNASPAIVKLRKELALLQDSTREGRAVNKLNKELEQLRKEAGAFRVSPGMRELSAQFKEIARTSGGTYDGWSAAAVARTDPTH